MARRRFFVPEIMAGRARLEGADAHHLTRVLRVEAGQKFEISDNVNVYLAEVEAAKKDLVTFVILERLPAEESALSVVLYASLIRFERFESLIEKATELGVERIVPVQAERSEKGLEAAAVKRTARWMRIVHEASEQSRRTRLAEIAPPLRLCDALKDAAGLRYALDEDRAAEPILHVLPAHRSASDRLALLAGPEGGWTERERAQMGQAAWRAVSLGRTILKTETAVIAALGVLTAAWQ